MPKKRLMNIQWQFVRQSVWVSVSATTFGATIVFFTWHYASSLASFTNWFHIRWGLTIPPFPGWGVSGLMMLILWAVAVVVGAGSGYVSGNLFKKRLEILLQSTMLLERGDLTTRIPFLGEDEIGQLGERLNEMTERFQKQVASLQRLSTHNAQLTEQAKQGAIIEERQRLARELHDAVSQQLFAISMTTAALKRLFSLDPEKARKQIERVEEMAAAAQSEMRALLLHLRPVHLEGKSLKQGVEDLLQELQSEHALNFTWTIEDLPDMPKGIEDHLFRILQEALSNTLRHSQAEQVDVKLSVIRQHARLKVTDNGIGFTAEEEQKASSYGMVLMRERVAEVGGVLNVSSAPGQGTMIEVTVPLITK